VLGVALELLRRLDPQDPVRLIGVRVAGLDENEARPEATPAAPGQLQLGL
jgi:hypothetical protein